VLKTLRKRLPWSRQKHDATGQLFAIAAHNVGEPFCFFREYGHLIENLGPLERAGILRDHPFIVGLIFLVTGWNLTDNPDAIERAFRLNGVWNSAWEMNNSFAPEAVATAKRTFEQLCHAWNDTEDSRSALLPTR
jgi:hypothetical protein